MIKNILVSNNSVCMLEICQHFIQIFDTVYSYSKISKFSLIIREGMERESEREKWEKINFAKKLITL